jgi:hypothetical protein
LFLGRFRHFAPHNGFGDVVQPPVRFPYVTRLRVDLREPQTGELLSQTTQHRQAR